MNEWLSLAMIGHALAGAVFVLSWKLLQEFEAVARRQEWVAAIAITLAYGAGKENIDRELSGPALMDATSYIWLAPLAIWAWGRWGPSGHCLLRGHAGPPNHNDYPPGLRWVPRAWTTYCKGRFARPPRLLRGNLEPGSLIGGWPTRGWGQRGDTLYPKPVPPRGIWIFCWPFYVALTTDGGWHARLGARYTETAGEKGNYYTIPSFTVKKLR